jgi:protein-disulfide isomerase
MGILPIRTINSPTTFKDIHVKLSHLTLLVGASVLVAVSQLAAADPASDALTPKQVNQVQGVVHDYLVTNPQVLVEASQSLQKQQMDQMEKKAKDSIGQNAEQIFANPMSPVAGNAKGDVTLVEFFDYQCPHCKDMKPIVDGAISGDPKLRVVYKELPIFGDSSRQASAAALAAFKQGVDKYLKLHEALLAADNPLNRDKVMQIAKSVGLDTDKLAKDMQSPDVKKQIDDNLQLAQTLQLIGTPTFIVTKWQVGSQTNNVSKADFIPGMPTANELKDAIAAARK